VSTITTTTATACACSRGTTEHLDSAAAVIADGDAHVPVRFQVRDARRAVEVRAALHVHVAVPDTAAHSCVVRVVRRAQGRVHRDVGRARLDDARRVSAPMGVQVHLLLLRPGAVVRLPGVVPTGVVRGRHGPRDVRRQPVGHRIVQQRARRCGEGSQLRVGVAGPPWRVRSSAGRCPRERRDQRDERDE